MSERTITEFSCEKCGEPWRLHTSVTWNQENQGQACPPPKLADVVPLHRTDQEEGRR